MPYYRKRSLYESESQLPDNKAAYMRSSWTILTILLLCHTSPQPYPWLQAGYQLLPSCTTKKVKSSTLVHMHTLNQSNCIITGPTFQPQTQNSNTYVIDVYTHAHTHTRPYVQCMYICKSIRTRVYVHLQVHTYTHLHTCVHTCVSTCMYTCVYAWTCMDTHTYKYTCVHVYIKA